MISIFDFNYINNFEYISGINLFIYSLALLSIGSFTSTTIFRLSNNISYRDILLTRSMCRNCNQKIKNVHLIPIIGFLIQRGKCSACKKDISLFYPVTEILFLIYGLIVTFVYGFGTFNFFLLLIFYIFYILFFLDLKFFYLPVFFNVLLIICGFIGNSLFNIFVTDITKLFNLSSFMFSFYGLLIGYLSLWLINFIFKLIYKKDGIGGGDFILFGAIGSLFGPFSLGLILFFGAIFGCFIFILFKKNYQNKIPLGSCLIVGSIFYFLVKNFELLDNLLVI